ncbi:MAG: hypothetical protein Q4F45_08520 [Alistipes sp.]|nr:hypothetical protein [Alistipes sp.]MDO5497910.1 hypothetical protein [Alistipes sp.]
MEQIFRVEISSKFEELWRYNIVLMGGGFNAKGEQVDFASSTAQIAKVGTNFTEKPAQLEDMPREYKITLSNCDNIATYIYLVPHTLPFSNEIGTAEPFDLKVEVWCDDEKIYSQRHKINQWSGASIELKLPKKEEEEK